MFLTDVNDNPPVFQSIAGQTESVTISEVATFTGCAQLFALYCVSVFIPQFAQPGSFVTVVSATDADEGVNGLVRYVITQPVCTMLPC